MTDFYSEPTEFETQVAIQKQEKEIINMVLVEQLSECFVKLEKACLVQKDLFIVFGLMTVIHDNLESFKGLSLDLKTNQIEKQYFKLSSTMLEYFTKLLGNFSQNLIATQFYLQRPLSYSIVSEYLERSVSVLSIIIKQKYEFISSAQIVKPVEELLNYKFSSSPKSPQLCIFAYNIQHFIDQSLSQITEQDSFLENELKVCSSSQDEYSDFICQFNIDQTVRSAQIENLISEIAKRQSMSNDTDLLQENSKQIFIFSLILNNDSIKKIIVQDLYLLLEEDSRKSVQKRLISQFGALYEQFIDELNEYYTRIYNQDLDFTFDSTKALSIHFGVQLKDYVKEEQNWKITSLGDLSLLIDSFEE